MRYHIFAEFVFAVCYVLFNPMVNHSKIITHGAQLKFKTALIQWCPTLSPQT